MPITRAPRYVKTLFIVTSAAIAASYVVLTLPFAQIAYGPLQFRLAECMAVLPILTPAAIPGITIGCFLANLFSPQNLGPIDIIFGSFATLLSAISTRWLYAVLKYQKSFRRDVISLIPPVVFNALIVGTYLTFLLTDGPVRATMIIVNIAYIALSEAIVVYLIGYPLLIILRKSGVGRIWEETKRT